MGKSPKQFYHLPWLFQLAGQPCRSLHPAPIRRAVATERGRGEPVMRAVDEDYAREGVFWEAVTANTIYKRE